MIFASVLALISTPFKAVEPPNLPDLIARLKPSVVSLTAKEADGTSTGTGFVVDSKGTVVTAAHVVQNATVIKATFSDGTERTVKSVKLIDSERDYALLELEPGTYRAVPMGDSAAVREGESVVAIGSPFGLQFTTTTGIISALRPLDWEKPLRSGEPAYLQFSAPISPGNSGGPLFDANGNVIGVNVFKRREGENLNFAVAINEVKRAIATGASNGNENWVIVSAKRKSPYPDQRWAIYNGKSLPSSLTAIRKELAAGWRITTIAEGHERWIVLYAKGIDLEDQQILSGPDFPREKIKDLWKQDFYITACVYSGDSWNVVMSHSKRFTNQSYKTGAAFDADYIKKKWGEGYIATTIESGGGLVVHVMSQVRTERVDASAVTVERVVPGDIAKRAEDRKWLVGANQFSGKWVLIYANDPEIEEQSVFIGSVYPEKWIRAQWDKGWDITVIR